MKTDLIGILYMSLLNCLSPIRILNTSKSNMRTNYKKTLLSSFNRVSRDYNSSDDFNYMLVSCGKCKNCLQRKSNEKSSRILDELEYYKYNFLDSISKKEMEYYRRLSFSGQLIKSHYEYQVIFATLTYRNDSISLNYSLCKDDIILFKKRVRRRLETFYKNELKQLSFTDNKYSIIYNDSNSRKKYIYDKMSRIKFVEAGEYGETYHRPHFHLLIFGLSPILRNYKLLASCWKKGKSQFEMVRSSSRATKYILKITKYITKSLFKHSKFYDKNIEILKKNIEPSYIQFSRGLGKRYALEHAESLYTQLVRHRYIERNCLNYHKPVELLKYTEPLPRQYCIWIQHSNEKYSDIFERRRSAFRTSFNSSIEYYSKVLSVPLPEYLNNSSDDFYDIYNYKKIYNYLDNYNNHKFLDYEKQLQFFHSEKKIRSAINDINMSNPDIKAFSFLPPNKKIDYYDSNSNKYICYYSNGSSPRSASRDYSFYSAVLVSQKERYKKYLNIDVFDIEKYNSGLLSVLSKLDNYIQCNFNVSDSDIELYNSFYKDCLNNSDSLFISSVDDFYIEYKNKILKLVYDKDVQYYFDFNNIDSLDTDNFVYSSSDEYSSIFNSEILDFSVEV